jgi:hypothetical protein
LAISADYARTGIDFAESQSKEKNQIQESQMKIQYQTKERNDWRLKTLETLGRNHEWITVAMYRSEEQREIDGHLLNL